MFNQIPNSLASIFLANGSACYYADKTDQNRVEAKTGETA
jgi:hypothetical protein